jgi:hypothetical protein
MHGQQDIKSVSQVLINTLGKNNPLTASTKDVYEVGFDLAEGTVYWCMYGGHVAPTYIARVHQISKFGRKSTRQLASALCQVPYYNTYGKRR